jgi:glutamyl-tRNA synthetase
VIRLKIPSGGMTKIHDRLLGDIEWKNDDVSPDPVLLKSDGFPTYHLANVVDDHLMEITHVLRAQEWLPSTPLHVIMYAAFGWQPPEFCHLPLVMGQDGHKLSKRHGSTSVDEFRDSGYLPQALLNYVGMLGASYEDGRDIYPLADMERLFSLDKLNKAPAVFDYKKLEWFNGQYIRMKSDEELSAMILPFAVKAGLFGKEEAAPDEAQKKLFVAAMGLVKERLSFLKDAPPMMAFLFSDPILPQAEDFIPKKLDAAKTVEILSAMERFFTDVLGKSDETIEELFRAQAERLEVKLGDLLMPVRVALTGTKVSPPLLGGIRLLGEAKTRERIKKAIERIKG